ncbi:MAG TPA: cysteine desulfurase [Bacteroidota bacterium]|nr:cysteine desulfurase [Bacteroidota bacterium]
MPDLPGLRRDFPALGQSVKGKPLVYLDNAATTQKPIQVIEAVSRYYRMDNANIHRGVHELSERATAAYESVREKVKRFINAAETREIVFVRGTTEGINLVAQTFGRSKVRQGDEVLISGLEHHSNIVPWQMLCGEKGASLKVAPINDAGEIIQDEFEKLLTKRTRIVAVGHVSNALGTVNPIKAMIAAAHSRGIPVLIDGAQAMAHMRVDVRDLEADFYVFSGHKMFGPTGIGVLYGKESFLNEMPPYQGGGDMIKSVSFEKTIYNDLPYKFEAGTPNIAGTIGLGAAVDYLSHLDIDAVEDYERELLNHATDVLGSIDGVRLIGTAREKLGVLSFLIKDIHPHDIGTILNEEGIAVRTGHHCAQPVMERFGVPATARASFALYNTMEEVDALARGIRRVQEVFS